MPSPDKKPKKGSDSSKTEEKEQVTIWFKPAVAKRLRARAVAEGKRYSTLAEELVDEGLRRRGG